MLLTELEIAERLAHPYFNGPELSDIAKKKRVRSRARETNIRPVIKKHNIWLFHEDDIESFTKRRSKLEKEKDRRTGRSRARSAVSACDRVRERLTSEKQS